jgi:hypothetical protein
MCVPNLARMGLSLGLCVRGARRAEPRATRRCVQAGFVWLTGVPTPLASGLPGYS